MNLEAYIIETAEGCGYGEGEGEGGDEEEG